MTKPRAIALNRRTILAGAGAATAALAAPRLLRAQGKELVVGGAASHKTFVETVIAPVVEKKYGCKIVFEGTRSLVNLEKMQKNKDKQYLSVVMMDDPVMIPAVAEGLLEKITPAKVPNIAALKPGTIHMDGMWANYLQPWLGIAYNPKVMKTAPTRGPTSTIPSTRAASSCRRCRTPKASPTFHGRHLATGKPMAEAQKDIDAAFKKLVTLKPNLLTAYTQMPQAYNLLEQGEGYMISSAISQVALERKRERRAGRHRRAEGRHLRHAVGRRPGEGRAAARAGRRLHQRDDRPRGTGQAPRPVTFSLPTNKDTPVPAGMPTSATVFVLDWKFVADNRADWVERWDRDMAM